MLKPQDLLVALKLLVIGPSLMEHTFASVAASLGLSVSETHAAAKRAVRCRLLSSIGHPATHRGSLPRASKVHLTKFIENGLPYVFPAETGATATGMPTSLGAAPLRDALVVGSGELVPVWPCRSESVRGITLKPLYRSCPEAAANDAVLYRLLALVDAIRDDGTRQRQVALDLFRREMNVLGGMRQQPAAVS